MCGALALATFFAAIPGARQAHAYSPYVIADGKGAGVRVWGIGFTPGAQLRVVLLDTSWHQVAAPEFDTANSSGMLSNVFGDTGTLIHTTYRGDVHVAVDQMPLLPALGVWGTSRVYLAGHVNFWNASPYFCGSVFFEASGFRGHQFVTAILYGGSGQSLYRISSQVIPVGVGGLRDGNIDASLPLAAKDAGPVSVYIYTANPWMGLLGFSALAC